MKTGDLGRFDEDGFLFIEGRLSRFSKIGGEMVPHETVEQKILAALELGNEGDRTIAVTSVVDPQKGEALVLLSTLEIDQAQLRSRLHDGRRAESLDSENDPAGRANSGAGDGQARSAEVQRNRSEGSGVNLVVAWVAGPSHVRRGHAPDRPGSTPGYKPTLFLRRRRTQAPARVPAAFPVRARRETFLSRLRRASARSAHRATAQ